MPSVFCANHAVKLIANQVGGAVPFPHINGCGQHGRDLQQTINTLAGIGKNPNFGAVLVIGLGCERVQAQELAGLIAQSGKPVRYLNIQQEGGTLKTVQAGVRMAREFAALLAGYLRGIPFVEIKRTTVSYMRIADLLLKVDGVEDIHSITVNGTNQSVTLEEIQFPIAGIVEIIAYEEAQNA